jgi:hypothetical protein
MSRRYYRDSALIAWLLRLPADTVIFSDEPEPIYFFAGRFAEQLAIDWAVTPASSCISTRLAYTASTIFRRLD